MLRYLPVLILIGLELYALIDCLRTDDRDIRNWPKVAWVLLIIFIPLIGIILWFTLGRPRSESARPTPHGPVNRGPVNRGPVAPDDDPEFLRNLDTARRHKAEEERLRQLRAELEERERKLRDQEN
ncbi:PLDc N-terminal domain-containing protein [Psychromicrobium lacuslunae]|uniref:Membrane protein n=1 Tax=Psychromicrobium lacuslunae TaxID=1618207 RepID=A0A0D4C0H5_9MICC|nr:PLDc N-terminal domain-containing protein [Psychromicrobium lacuslunae]AJT41920.1 membrane protein [Psychromicrobium lacuslunae]